MKKKWIQQAIQHPGAMMALAKRAHMTTAEMIQKGLTSKNPTTKKRAILARTLRSFKKGK